MSLLAPLYVAGLALLSLPILLHLIRRVPRGQVPFSSLMFLTQSPPRITRRSRIDHWLLLLLRAAIVTLLVMAFSRPFLREASQLTTWGQHARRVVVLVDTSASMRRGDLWNQALEAVQRLVDSAGTRDEIAVYAFDEQTRVVIDFANDDQPQQRHSASAVRRALEQFTPSWRATDLGDALATAAERLVERNDRRQSDAALQIYVASDLPQGAQLDSLQSYEWPAQVAVELLPLRPQQPGNTSVQVIADRERSQPTDEVRLLVSNEPDATREQFELTWISRSGEPIGKAAQCYVPPGQVRTVRMRRPNDARAEGLRLTGDEQPFDNTVYLAPPSRMNVRVVYVGQDATDDPQGLAYFLDSALAGSTRFTSELITATDRAAIQQALAGAALAVVSGNLSEDAAAMLRSFAEDGGSVLVAVPEEPSVEALRQLMDDPALDVSDSKSGEYAMFADIDFTHPVFASLAGAPYSDFTKVRFWKTRDVAFSDDSALRTIARFDDQRPAFVEQSVGAGRIYLLASTWRPVDSQLALSSKFVPLINGLLRGAGIEVREQSRTIVGKPIVLDPLTTSAESVVIGPDGKQHVLPRGATEFTETQQPGLYRRQVERDEQVFAVNLDAAESRTAPLDPTRLEQFAVRLGSPPDEQQQRERQRQLQDQELESRQQIWRWMIAAALGLMVVETFLASRPGRRHAAADPSAENSVAREREEVAA